MNAFRSIDEFSKTYDRENLNWFRVTGSPRFDYPIDYSVAVLDVNEEQGTIDFLSRWEPDAYCHYHSHLGETSVLVIEGEHHVVETSNNETVHKTRRPGFATTNPGGDCHMEYGGPEGSLVFFSCKSVDGKLFDVMDKDGTVLKTAMVSEFTDGSI